MPSTAPLVSIIIPSFNQGRFIQETIDSCLAQNYRPIEVLVMDGGSRDETTDLLRRCSSAELRWWSEPDGGVVDAVNKGMARAKGDVLTIQSSDDLFLPGALTTAVGALVESPEAGLVFGDVELIDEHSQVIGADVQGAFDLAEYLGRLQYIPQPGTCFTRAAMQSTGDWRQSVSFAADADFWMRIAVRFPVRKVTKLLGRYRYHLGQRDTQRTQIARDWRGAVMDLIAGGALNARLRRYAHMGMHLSDHRYADPEDWPARTRALYLAAIANPRGLLDPRFPKRELIPGRDPVWSVLSRIKRRLGLHPRAS